MLPTTATPSAPPSSRVVSLTAEPMLARVGRERAHDRLGRGRAREAHARAHQHERDGEPAVAAVRRTVAATARPGANSSIPSVAMRLVPKRSTSFADTDAKTIIAPAYGSTRTPAADGEYPSTNCRYCVAQEQEAEQREEQDHDRAARRAEARVAEQRDVEQRLGARRCWTTNAPSSTAATRDGAEHGRRRPARRRRFDDRPHERDQPGARERGARSSRRAARPGRATRGRRGGPTTSASDAQRHVDEEDRAPREVVEQEAADDRPERDAEARRSPPRCRPPSPARARPGTR